MRSVLLAMLLVASGVVAASDSVPVTPQPPISVVTLQAINFPDRYIRHLNFVGQLTHVQSQQDVADATFKIVPGLNGQGISFQATNPEFPNYYLHHRNFQILLEQNDNTNEFNRDATFFEEPGLADPSLFSYRAAYSNQGKKYYIRHHDFAVYIQEGDGSALFKQDSTFKKVTTPKAVLITGRGPYHGPVGFSRGMQTTTHCECDHCPESWVRGSATYSKGTGDLSLVIQLETDDTAQGPKGKVTATLKDDQDHILGTATTDEVGMGGKPPGQFIMKDANSTQHIDKKIGPKISSISVEAQCTGKSFALWGEFSPDDIVHGIEIAIKYF